MCPLAFKHQNSRVTFPTTRFGICNIRRNPQNFHLIRRIDAGWRSGAVITGRRKLNWRPTFEPVGTGEPRAWRQQRPS